MSVRKCGGNQSTSALQRFRRRCLRRDNREGSERQVGEYLPTERMCYVKNKARKQKERSASRWLWLVEKDHAKGQRGRRCCDHADFEKDAGAIAPADPDAAAGLRGPSPNQQPSDNTFCPGSADSTSSDPDDPESVPHPGSRYC